MSAATEPARAVSTIGFLGRGSEPLIGGLASVGIRIVQLNSSELGLSNLHSDGTAHAREDPSFHETLDLSRVEELNAVIVCVPATINSVQCADTRAVAATAEVIGKRLRANQLVVYTGNLPPGTMRQTVLPRLGAAGMKAGRDFFLAYSTEPVGADVTRTIGGLDPASTDAAEALFRRAGIDVRRVSSLEVAEICGAVGAIVRATQVAVTNELRIACNRMGLDAWEILTASGVQSMTPTLGDRDSAPLLLSWGTRRHGALFRLVDLGGEINARMPAFVVDKITDALNDAGKPVKGSQVAILGLIPEKDFDWSRSPSVELMERLLKKGAVVSYNDPHIPHLPQMQRSPHVSAMESQPLTSEYLAAQDCVLVAVVHAEYTSDFLVQHSRLIVDTCNVTRAVSAGREKIVKL